jgi:hypothetical protein
MQLDAGEAAKSRAAKAPSAFIQPKISSTRLRFCCLIQ